MKTIHYLLLAAGLCVLTSACDDESSEGARLTFEPALESLEFTTEGGSQTFLLYSNVPEWSIRCRYGDEWIDVWPAEGDFDGRFSVTVDENDRAELRYDHLETATLSSKQILLWRILRSIFPAGVQINSLMISGGSMVRLPLVMPTLHGCST